MTTLEKLFVQIFERKDWIIEQIQHQADAYNEQLACRLLIDGITPPPCLLNPRFNSHPSDPHGLKKEEIISKLLLGPPRNSVAYSSGGPSLYYRPVITGGNGQLPNEMSMETHAPNKFLNVTNGPPVTLACPKDGIGCSLNEVTEQDNSDNSPQNETDARISSIYAAPDTSLARIQRSKSRQKARELQTSGKSCLGDENRSRISFTVSKSDSHQDKFPSEPVKCNDMSGNGTSCDDKDSFLNDHSKTSDKEELDGGVNLHDTSLGSYGAKKSESSKTHDAQRQSNHYSGRITRSRGSRQDTSGITTGSCNPKEGNNASNKLLDAVCNNGIGETQAISSNKSVKKSVISSNIAGSRVSRSNKECPLDANQENADIVVGNGPVEAQVAMQPVNSLVPVTMCTESDGLCMLVKPKQLNFDEMDGCDSSKVSSLVSKKRKLDGLLGQELAMENVVSSPSKYTRTYSDECTNVETMNIGLDMNENTVVEDVDDGLLGQECNSNTSIHHNSSGTFFEECAKDETMNIGLDMKENEMVEGIEENSRVSLHDDGAVFHEADKGEENNGDVSIPNSSLTKQEVRRTSHQDLGSSKSKEFEVGTNSKLSNLKLNSAKFNTWPRDPHRNIDDQRTCFSDSQDFRVHIQRDAIHCDLEASEKDIQRVHDEMMCDLPDGTESLHELQDAKATVIEVDDDMAAEDQTINEIIMPVYEGFTMDEKMEIPENEIDFDTLEIPSTTIERASILEQICKSATTNTPFSQFSSTFKQHQVQDFYKFMPDGLLPDMDLENHLSESDCDYTFPNQQSFDSVRFSGTPLNWQSKNYYSSPVGKFWDRSASSSGSSENRLSSNPELTCFPIEEDPNSNEESENDQLQENKSANQEKDPITEMEIVTTENDDEVAVEIVPKIANHEPPMKYRDRCSSNSVNIPKTHDKVKYKSKFHPGIKYEEEKRTPSIYTRGSIKRNTSSLQTQNSIRRNVSLQTQNSKNKSRIQKEAKRNNIVSNITSFVSIVQQKQAAAVCTGKREIKVKALEAAEAAKRREQEKENERKMKKEALKIERARVEKENTRKMELNKRKKHEELKKKEADVAARKKQREEDERKQMAKRRKIAEARKEQHEKSRGGKHVVIAGNKKGSENLKENRNENVVQQIEIIEKSPGQVRSMRLTSQQESSYDISPYQCSDDEDEDEDDLHTKKFVPSWASKRAVAMVLPLQQELDPERIFPEGSFCSMDEVLLPRRLQAQ